MNMQQLVFAIFAFANYSGLTTNRSPKSYIQNKINFIYYRKYMFHRNGFKGVGVSEDML